MGLFSTIYHLPGTIISGTASILLGSNTKYIDFDDEEVYEEVIWVHETQRDSNGNPTYEVNPSIIGFIANASRGIGNFLSDHKTAIATAFWAALLAFGVAAAVVACVPALLATAVNYTIGGYSIALLVGTEFTAQVLAVGGVAAAAASSLVVAGASVVNLCKAAFDLCFGGRSSSSTNPRGPRVICGTLPPGHDITVYSAGASAAPASSVSVDDASRSVHFDSPMTSTVPSTTTTGASTTATVDVTKTDTVTP